MVNSMMNTLTSQWHFMRWLRLGLGLLIGVQAIQSHETISGVIAVFLLVQALTNTGCCGSGGCAVPSKAKQSKAEDITYEEVN
jgi:hypothetical protein